MNKIGYLLMLTLLFYACGIPDDSNNGIIETPVYLPFESVSMPSEFVYGQTYLIEYSYYRPSTCHHFMELVPVGDLNVMTILIRARLITGAGQCANFQDELETRSFNVTVDSWETYIFKFWQGTDDNGQDIYLQMEIPVIE